MQKRPTDRPTDDPDLQRQRQRLETRESRQEQIAKGGGTYGPAPAWPGWSCTPAASLRLDLSLCCLSSRLVSRSVMVGGLYAPP